MTLRLETGGGRVALFAVEPLREDDGRLYLEALEEIGRRDQPFVLLVSIAVPLDLTHEQRKAQNLWYKRTREHINGLCRACALIRDDPTGEAQRSFQGLYAFPVLVTGRRDEAEAFLARHAA